MHYNFLPGPVFLNAEIKEIFLEDTFSHRSNEFNELLKNTKLVLKKLTKAENLEIVSGSGTLTNDIVAHQLKCISGKGIILSSGEFGKRLVDHAKRIDLDFIEYSSPPGTIIDFESIEIDNSVKWIWTVHCETSTGCVYNLDLLKSFAKKNNLCIALDCISSIGLNPLDLSDVDFATATSGKGLASAAGLGIVFYKKVQSNSNDKIPRYLDLGYYKEADGIPFTLQSNQLKALFAAASRVQNINKPLLTKRLDTLLRAQLDQIGISILSPTNCAAPGMLTLVFDNSISSLALGRKLENSGFYLHYQNRYLANNNWIQISLMSEHTENSILLLVSELNSLINYSMAA